MVLDRIARRLRPTPRQTLTKPQGSPTGWELVAGRVISYGNLLRCIRRQYGEPKGSDHSHRQRGCRVGYADSHSRGLILSGQRSASREIVEIRSDIADLLDQMARLEGLFEGHLNEDCP